MGSITPTTTPSTGPAATTPVTKEYKSGNPEVMNSMFQDQKAIFEPPTFPTKQEEQKFLKHRLAIAYRILAAHGLSDHVAGHITVRDPIEPTSFWVNPFGMNFALITDDDLIRVNHAGEVVEGGRLRLLNRAAYAIHHEIHTARPDVLCAVHSHTVYGRAFSATGPRPLSMLTQDFCTFHNDHVHYANFSGIVLASEEGRQIAAALGPRKAAILGNHGLLTVGETVEAAVGYFLSMENLCKTQMVAEATGRELTVIGEEEAQAVYEVVGTARAGYFMGLPYFQVAEAEFGEKTFLGKGVEPL